MYSAYPSWHSDGLFISSHNCVAGQKLVLCLILHHYLKKSRCVEGPIHYRFSSSLKIKEFVSDLCLRLHMTHKPSCSWVACAKVIWLVDSELQSNELVGKLTCGRTIAIEVLPPPSYTRVRGWFLALVRQEVSEVCEFPVTLWDVWISGLFALIDV